MHHDGIHVAPRSPPPLFFSVCFPCDRLARVIIFPPSLAPPPELVDFFVHEGAVDVVFYIAACHMHTSPPVMEELSRVLALSCSIGTLSLSFLLCFFCVCVFLLCACCVCVFVFVRS